MTNTPDDAAIQRVAAYVRRALDAPGFLKPTREEIQGKVSPEVLDIAETGTGWLDAENRSRLEEALRWKQGDLEWIARGGEPSTLMDDRRKWRVRMVIERTVEAPTDSEALQAVGGPIREAFATEEAGIVEASALAVRENSEVRAGREAAARDHRRWLMGGEA